MLSSVLRSERAVRVNIAIMRAFVRLRETLVAHKELAAKLTELERRVARGEEGIQTLFEAIRRLMERPERPRKERGFQVWEKRARYTTATSRKPCRGGERVRGTRTSGKGGSDIRPCACTRSGL
jgi:hypothetical protein